jgi:glycosyltransferase involved in cell wall biosynthesis
MSSVSTTNIRPPESSTTRLRLSVIVCAYTIDRWDDIGAAVHSLLSQDHHPDEIILVVDHCEALYARAAAQFETVRVVRNTERRGLSGARNTGVREAHGDVVAFLDDDAAADHRWAVNLLAPYADPRVLGVGGLVAPRWQTGRPSWFPREFDWVVGCSYRGMPTVAAPVRNFIGANMSFRRSVLARQGGFRHDLGRIGTRPLGGEETEFCIRALLGGDGGTLVYQPAAAVRHRVPERRGAWGYFRARCFGEGLSKATVSRHAGAQAALASERAYLTSTIPAALLRPLRAVPDRPRLSTVPAVIVGVAWTVAGYCIGRLSDHGQRFPRRRQTAP